MAENRFYVWQQDKPREFVPPHDPAVDESNPGDIRYFARILEHVNALLGPRGLTFLLTWHIDRFDAQFDNAVVLAVGDEKHQIPLYAPRAKIIFKTGGVRPNPVGSWLQIPFHIAWRVALRELRNRTHGIKRRFRRPPGAIAPIYAIPIGYHRLVDVPFVPFSQRTVDAFFAGALASDATFQVRPSVVARQDLAVAIRAVQAALPQFRSDINMTSSGFKYDPPTYSRMLMQSKIALCPRGNFDETFRMLEAAKSGCIIICEPLPQRWYHQSLPAIQLRSWNALLPAIRDLLNDPAQMERLHVQTRQWWTDYASERAVAQYIVKQVATL